MFRPATLKEVQPLLDPLVEFVPGDKVRLKKGMKNKKFPEYGQTLIVTDLLPPGTRDTGAEPGTTYYLEPLHFRAALIDSDDEIREYCFDARRFERVE